ncbi:MAG: TIGR00730 family Rossman fold protein [Rhodospirillales bacterium]
MKKPLAFEDKDLMWRDELRPTRLAAEFHGAELMMLDHRIRSTVVVFGSARANRASAAQNGDPASDLSLYLDLAEETAFRITRFSEQCCARDPDGFRDFVICTGGGPGIMEAANRGADRAGGISIGLNIQLPKEQHGNPYITPDLNLRFHYFAMRKMHLMMRAKALVIFPGGYGTLDELFEALTLVQTGKVARIPIVMFGEAYWRKVIDFDHLVAAGAIDRDDADLFEFVSDVGQAVGLVCPGA